MTTVLMIEGYEDTVGPLETMYEKAIGRDVAIIGLIVGTICWWAGVIFSDPATWVAAGIYACSFLAFAAHLVGGQQAKLTAKNGIPLISAEYISNFERYNAKTTPTQGLTAVRNAWLGGLQMCAGYMNDLTTLQHEQGRFSASFEEARSTVTKTYRDLFGDFKHYEVLFQLSGTLTVDGGALAKATDIMIQEVLACAELSQQAAKLYIEAREPTQHDGIILQEIQAVTHRLDALMKMPQTPMIEAGPSYHEASDIRDRKPIYEKKKVGRDLKSMKINKGTGELIETLLEDLDGAVVPRPDIAEQVLKNVETDSLMLRNENTLPGSKFCWSCPDCIRNGIRRRDCNFDTCIQCEALREKRDLTCTECELDHASADYFARVEEGGLRAHKPDLRLPSSVKYAERRRKKMNPYA